MVAVMLMPLLNKGVIGSAVIFYAYKACLFLAMS